MSFSLLEEEMLLQPVIMERAKGKKEELGNRGRGSIDFSVENSGGRETKIHTQGERLKA